MSETSNQKALIEQLLSDRDAEFRRAVKAERQLKELSDVKRMQADYEARLAEKEKAIQERDRALESKESRIAQLEQKLLYLERKMWGAMSEKRRIPDDPNQLKLDFDLLEMTPEEEETVRKAVEEVTEYRKVTVKEHEKRVPVRQKLPDNLRRVEEHIYPDGYLGHEDEWILFGDAETSEHLELQPAELYVRVTIRHKGMRKETKEIVTAPVQNEPIAKSYASASLLTDLMRPAYYRLRELVLSTDYIQSDETTVPIIDNEKHRTVKGYLWLVRSMVNGLVFFAYNEGSRGAKVVLQLFKDYQGAIQTDGYAGYNILEKLEGITTLGCWVHTRRYFDRALTHDKARAEYALAQIGMLYDVEGMADDQHMDTLQRMELRKRLAYPIIRAFEKWCICEQGNVLPKSPIGKAIGYFLNNSRQLVRYTMDGRYLPDTNLIENSVRPVAVGRKNYLFCGNHDAAEDAAVIYSLMGCCKAADVDFKQWMNYFLNHVHEYDSDYSKNLVNLLPHSLKEQGVI